MGSLLDKIKADAKKSGGNKAKFIYFREGEKQRIRFLQDMDEGMEVVFHDSYEAGINVPCQEIFGRDCPYCEEEDLRTRSQYCWSVWNYETNQVQLFMFPVNNCSPVPALTALYETYGTLTDRDYMISVQGKQQNKTFSVVPMDKGKFRNTKAKPYSKKQVLGFLDKAWPADDVDGSDDDDFEDEDDNPMPKPTNKNKKSRNHKEKDGIPFYEDDGSDYDDDDDWGDDEDSGTDYESMSPKELFSLCKERGIKVPPKKPAKFYINQLKEWDAAQDDWADDDDDDEWEDEE